MHNKRNKRIKEIVNIIYVLIGIIQEILVSKDSSSKQNK